MAKRKLDKEFFDDEAELSEEDKDKVSDDESSDDEDGVDLDIVDKEASDLDSEEEEEVRDLYHKQLDSEDKRAVLLLQEQLEEKELAVGQQRRRRFRWQESKLDVLPRHYDLDEDANDEDDNDDNDLGTDFDEDSSRSRTMHIIPPEREISQSIGAVASSATLRPVPSSSRSQGINKFIFRDRELVQALSTVSTTRSETLVTRQVEREKLVQREIKRIQAESVFDVLY